MNPLPSVRKPSACQCTSIASERQLVSRQLLDDEPIVRQILVQRSDHVIAVGIRPRKVGVLKQRVAFRVGITGHVEPMPPPTLAIAGRSEQPIDDPLEGIVRRIGQKLRHLRRGRWQADQIELHTPQQCTLVGGRRWREPVRFQLGQYETIDRRSTPRSLARPPAAADCSPVGTTRSSPHGRDLRFLGRPLRRGDRLGIGRRPRQPASIHRASRAISTALSFGPSGGISSPP